MDGEFSGVNITYEDFLGQFSGGGINFIGRVGVCVNGIVGSVCDINWDQDDASVFCNGVLGVVGDYGEFYPRLFKVANDNITW